MYRIMIVEDDGTITQVMERHLSKWGYSVQTVTDFASVTEQFEAYQPHLVLLDISLPYFNGYHWCQEIRKSSQTPILFISSSADDVSQVMALNLGADDFIPKPFHLDILTAKIQAILRRTYAFSGDKNILEAGGIRLDLGGAALQYTGRQVDLTKNEMKIMQMLIENRGRAVSRDSLIQRLWESESFIDDNTLTVNINRLRRKLEGIGLGDLIVTKKGLGYLAEL